MAPTLEYRCQLWEFTGKGVMGMDDGLSALAGWLTHTQGVYMQNVPAQLMRSILASLSNNVIVVR